MSKQQLFDKVDLLGVEIDAVSSDEAITILTDTAKDIQTPAIYVVKPYVEFIDRASGRPDLQELLNNAEYALADGIALIWASAYLYAGKRSFWRFWQTLFQIMLSPTQLYWPLFKPYAGINFTWPLLETAAAKGLRIYLVGKESQNDIRHVVTTLQAGIPQIHIVGFRHGRDPNAARGEVSTAWVTDLGTDLVATKADLVLVGMGFPLQEGIAAALVQYLDHGVVIGEGGTFDYDKFGGSRKKAPAWIQRLWLEWLWRLFLEPRRFRRQLSIPRFIYKIWRSRK